MRLCPRCQVVMTSETRTFATLDRCGTCGGVLADPGEGRSVLGHRHEVGELSRTGLAEIVGASALPCADGHGRMAVYRIQSPNGALEVDVCATCSVVFFDAGEAELFQALSARAGEVQTASGARFSAPPADTRQSLAVAEAQAASAASPVASFWGRFVLGAVADLAGRRRS